MATIKFKGFNNIVFTTDFSDASDEAFIYALNMAKSYGSKLFILNVVDTSADAAGFYLPHINFDNLDKDMKIASMELIKKSYDKRLRTFKRYSYTVLMGSPHKEIIKYVNKVHADLVVMGTYGHSGLDHLIFGSTTERVLKKARCPVLAIHPK